MDHPLNPCTMATNTPSRAHRSVLLLLLLAARSFPANTQSTLPKAEHDSLWAVWSNEAQADSNRLKAIYDLAWDGYLFSQPDSAIHYARMQYDVAERKGSKKYMAAALNLQGVAAWMQGDYATATEHLARTMTLQEELGDKHGMARTLNNIGSIYKDQGDYAKAIDTYGRSLKIYEEARDKPGTALPLGNIASVYEKQGDYSRAIDYMTRSLAILQEAGDKHHMAQVLNNIGLVYRNEGDNARAIDYFTRSLKIHEAIEARSDMAKNLTNIGLVYEDQGDHARAIENYSRSLKIQEEIGDKGGIATSLDDIGLIYEARGEHNRALDHLERSLKIREEIGDQHGIATAENDIGLAYKNEGDYPKAAEHYSRGLTISEAIGDKLGIPNSLTNLGEIHYRQGDYAKALSFGTRSLALAQELGIIVQIRDAADVLNKVYKATGQCAKALAMYELHVQMRDSVMRTENQREVIRHEYKYEYEKKEALASAEQEKKDALATEELRRKKLQRNAFIGGFGLMVLLAGVFFTQRNRISKERNRSESLLLNILPSEVAEELKDTGAAAAKHFEQATILFSDFKGFTAISERLSAEQLVEELNVCFRAFDHIITERGIEKIKTIGDAYMCAGGLPDPKTSSPAAVVQAALAMQAFMARRKVERDTLGEPAFEMRVGIHTGPVVAGIVGVKKFQYDIWGDTVNIASRMESSGAVGQVNISEATYAFVKDDPGLIFTPRGKVHARGKGELEMYFVENRCP